MKRAITLSLAILFLPLSIFGMVVCCHFCSWLIYIPVLIVGIFLDFVDFALIIKTGVDIEMEDEMNLKDYEDYLNTGGR